MQKTKTQKSCEIVPLGTSSSFTKQGRGYWERQSTLEYDI